MGSVVIHQAYQEFMISKNFQRMDSNQGYVTLSGVKGLCHGVRDSLPSAQSGTVEAFSTKYTIET
jgi:hypothetical protein